MTELEKLVNESFGIMCNANDFFAFATADSVTIEPADLKWVLPIYEKYPEAGLNACMAYIAKIKPIKPWQTEEFNKAYAELEELNPEVQSEY